MSDQPRKSSSPLADALRLFVRNKPALISFIAIVLLGVAAVSGSLFVGRKADASDLIRMEEASLVGDRFKSEVIKNAVLDPHQPELKDTFLPPNSQSSVDLNKTYWLGTDNLGRDVLARLWAGSSISLTIGFLAVGISVFLGISLGGIAGYFGRNRVGLPMFATLMLFLAWGVMLAAGISTPAWICFTVGALLFAFQFLLSVAGQRWRTVGFFTFAALLFGAISWFNWRTENQTPEGAVHQAALDTHRQARELLLDLRDAGREFKEFEEAAPDNITHLLEQKDLPAWIYRRQFGIEVKTRLLDLQVGRFEIRKFRSALLEAQRLHQEQQERAEHLESFAEDYKIRHEQAVKDEQAATARAQDFFRSGKNDEGRTASLEAANHAARASTFDPAELKKRTKRMREIGAARQKYVEAVMAALEEPLSQRVAALDKADQDLAALLEADVKDAAGMREAQFNLEAVVRGWKRAEADFKEAEGAKRLEALGPIVEALAKGSREDAGLADLQAEQKRLTAAQEGLKAAAKTAAEDVARLKTIQGEPPEESKKSLPLLKVQGSNDLMDRRGQLRTRFVIRFDTEAKNSLTTLRGAELLSGQYRYGVYRITSHFLTATFLYLLLAVAALALMASGQASITDTKLPVKGLFLPTITVDDLVMRFTEIMMTIPVIFLILAILAIFEKDVFITMGVIGLTSWMGTTRFVRAEILSLREQDFVQAARSLGLSDFRIIWRHLVPNAISPVLVSASIGVAGAVLAESTLSFLGIGAKPEQTTWGQILSEGREYIFDAPWLTWIPGVAILITVLSFNLLGEGLREAFNPKLRGR